MEYITANEILFDYDPVVLDEMGWHPLNAMANWLEKCTVEGLPLGDWLRSKRACREAKGLGDWYTEKPELGP